MYITDLNGCLIEVTDLDKAIQITAEYKEYRHKDKSYSEFNQKQKAYWTDMYEKLTAIKVKVTTH
ncbi:MULTISPECIES: hypothetical protein [unclassified Arcicella]|jgi:hypothetical protein|uniref:hypothetical protein n=1 Tax=unclassified Arcicella TaxID=2644986 RepID=UPI00286212F7|nr:MULTISPECIES: hypothetical protein [unclassified Arcicella]MDR6561447.1 hypothetical protein [Arcicella sp. BE51]MDR6811331.1 hypothetical protein [Arcicella sp. BE140]MDR6822681.1 hypothetical protein [Arcicella sp. BE139]